MSKQSPFAKHAARSLQTGDSNAIPSDLDLVIEQRVTDAGITAEQYWVVIRDGVAAVELDELSADIVISQDTQTASDIQAGKTNAQTAYLTGRLTIDGDVERLLTVGPTLQSIVAAMAPTPKNDA